MAVFVQNLWRDGKVQYPGRRKIVDTVSGDEKLVQVSREEGLITEVGDEFGANLLNNLETRLALAFDEIEAQVKNPASRVDMYYPVGKIFMALKDFKLDQSTHLVINGNEFLPKTKWVRLKDRKLLIPASTQSSSTQEKVTVSFGGSISVSKSVGITYLTEAQIPPHKHIGSDYDINVSVSKKAVTYWNLDDDLDCGYKDKNPIGTERVTSYASEGSGHTHGTSAIYASFTPTPKEISTRQRCLKIYAWQRTE